MSTRRHSLPGLILTEMEFRVPLDHAKPGAEQISIFARGAVAPDKEDKNLPWLVFFQGGPGSAAPRPETNSGWLKRALQDYRVLLLDQRGTGRSTPVTHQALARFSSPQAQAAYVKHFRADNIVRDAEFIRSELVGETKPWSTLGQSFGGFCAVRYLSAAPEGLRQVFITGGLPPLARSADDIYRATYRRVADRNRRYYERYPEDAERAQEIVAFLTANRVRLPGGGVLTPRRFQQIGLAFGMSNGFEQAHYLLENAFVPGLAGRELSYVFLRGVENHQTFDTNPIYAMLHEAEYCQGAASNWSASACAPNIPSSSSRPTGPCTSRAKWSTPGCMRTMRVCCPLRRLPSFSLRTPIGRRYTIGRSWSETRFLPRLPSTMATCTSNASLGGDRAQHPGTQGLDHQRVRSQRPAGRRRAGLGSLDQHDILSAHQTRERQVTPPSAFSNSVVGTGRTVKPPRKSRRQPDVPQARSTSFRSSGRSRHTLPAPEPTGHPGRRKQGARRRPARSAACFAR